MRVAYSGFRRLTVNYQHPKPFDSILPLFRLELPGYLVCLKRDAHVISSVQPHQQWQHPFSQVFAQLANAEPWVKFQSHLSVHTCSMQYQWPFEE